jgi:hypothetical protein
MPQISRRQIFRLTYNASLIVGAYGLVGCGSGGRATVDRGGMPTPSPTPSSSPSPSPSPISRPARHAGPADYIVHIFSHTTKGNGAGKILNSFALVTTQPDSYPYANSDAILWDWKRDTYVLLNRSGEIGFTAWDINEKYIVGTKEPTLNTQRHALRWDIETGNITDLHPSGYSESKATSVWDGYTVGYAIGDLGNTRAIRWNNETGESRDISPYKDGYAFARAVNGLYTVGWYNNTDFPEFHAVIWDNSTGEFFDLHPSGHRTTIATGVSDEYTVGTSGSLGESRALLWHNSTRHMTDLTPSDFRSAEAHDTNGHQTVGSGGVMDGNYLSSTEGDYAHALLWDNANAECIDLHPVFGSTYIDYASSAGGIDINGNISGQLTSPSRGASLSFVLEPASRKV